MTMIENYKGTETYSTINNDYGEPIKVPFTEVMQSTFDAEIDHNPQSVGCFEMVSIGQFWTDAEALGFDTGENRIITYNSIFCPTRSTSKSAGYDFRSPFDFTLAPGQTIIIPTGIRVKMYSNNVLTVYPRSSIGIKHNIMLSNTTPVIDADYYNAENEGHIMLAFKNTVPKSIFPWKNRKNTWKVKAGDKVAQGIFLQYGITHNDNVNTVRTGGIGSTGA